MPKKQFKLSLVETVIRFISKALRGHIVDDLVDLLAPLRLERIAHVVEDRMKRRNDV